MIWAFCRQIKVVPVLGKNHQYPPLLSEVMRTSTAFVATLGVFTAASGVAITGDKASSATSLQLITGDEASSALSGQVANALVLGQPLAENILERQIAGRWIAQIGNRAWYQALRDVSPVVISAVLQILVRYAVISDGTALTIKQVQELLVYVIARAVTANGGTNPDINSEELTGSAKRSNGKQLAIAAYSHYPLDGAVDIVQRANTGSNYSDCSVSPAHLGEIQGAGFSWAACTGFSAEGANHLVLEYGNSTHYVAHTQTDMASTGNVQTREDHVFWEYHGTGAGFKVSQLAYVNPKQPLSDMNDAFNSAEALSNDIVYKNGGYNYLQYQEQFTDTHFYGSELCVIGESGGFGFGFEACPGQNGQ